jgi:hypothetical protein
MIKILRKELDCVAPKENHQYDLRDRKIPLYLVFQIINYDFGK